LPDQVPAAADARLVEDVVERFTASGTHQGDLMGVPGTGATIALRGMNIFRISDGKIVERWGQLDQLGVLHQLGLTPPIP
jgi:predicted ester cyclase